MSKKYKVGLLVSLEFEVEGDFDFEDSYPYYSWVDFLDQDHVINIEVESQEEL